jgi:hypothetical protein
MAVGNTFGATALSSYGGFWISYAIILTPGFGIINAYTANKGTTLDTALGFYLAGWFIFTPILLICTLRSTVAFFLLFFFLDMAFLLLTIAKFRPDQADTINAAGGYFGLFAAFMAWYNALAGIADDRLVLPTEIQVSLYLTLIPTATPSFSSPLHTSHGLPRAARPAPLPPNPSARLYRFGFTIGHQIEPSYCSRASFTIFKEIQLVIT